MSVHLCNSQYAHVVQTAWRSDCELILSLRLLLLLSEMLKRLSQFRQERDVCFGFTGGLGVLVIDLPGQPRYTLMGLTSSLQCQLHDQTLR